MALTACWIFFVASVTHNKVGLLDRDFKWDNYLNRFHLRHTDLMDVLAGYQIRATAPLDRIAVLLDLPGKMGQSGAKVWDQYQLGQIEEIRDYCETDVLNTFLIYLRWELLRGQLSQDMWRKECLLVKSELEEIPCTNDR